MKKQSYTYHFKNELNSLRDLKKSIIQIGKDHEVKEPFVRHIRLSLEELIVNIISHGRADNEIELKINCFKDHFVFYLKSGGFSFNPLTYETKSDAAKERKPGGLGVLIAKAFMDSLSYEYKDGYNCITLTKKINSVI